MKQRGHAVALAARVDDEDHRRTQQGGDVRRGTCGPPRHRAMDASVKQTHHALDDRDVGSRTPVPVQRTDQFLADQHRVEVAARPTGRQRVVAGVDVVRADLEWRDPMTGLPQRTDQSRCHGGFSAARRRRGDHHGRSHHSISRDRACLQATRRGKTRLCARSRRLHPQLARMSRTARADESTPSSR